MALSEVDGNSIFGICFVGYRNHAIRAGFVLGPIGLLLLISAFFICRGLLQLGRIKNAVRESSEAAKKIDSVIFHMATRAVILFVLIGGSFVLQFYEFRNSHIWAEGLHKLIV